MKNHGSFKLTTRDIAYIAIYLALFYVLDLISNFLPKMPQGGSLGLGTVALLLASYHLGWQKGLITSLLSVLLQFATGQMYLLSFAQFLFDYLIAFGIYGIACLFPNWKWFYSGVLITNAIRFVSATIAGVLFWETEWWASAVYQAWYMIPTTIVGLIFVPLLVHALGGKFARKA
jgi:thiamine transporter